MGIGAFAGGMADGLETGRRLGESVLQGRSASGVREATEILSEMQNMMPTVGTAGAVPDGTGAGVAAPTGFSGEEWDSVKSRYTKALSKISNVDEVDAMMTQMANLEKDKVMEYGRMALAAIKSGDIESAQRYAAGVSYYTDPGVTPTIQVQPDGTILAASEGSPPMVLTPGNLEDFLHQYSNFEDYRDFAFDREKHADLMAHRERERLDSLAAAVIAGDNDSRRTDAQVRNYEANIAESEYDLSQKQANAGLNTDILSAELEKLRADTDRLAATADSTRSKAQIDAVKERTTAANSVLDNMMEMPGTSKGGSSDGGIPDLSGPDATDLSPESQSAIAADESAAEVLDADTNFNRSDASNARSNTAAALARARSNPARELDLQTIIAAMSRSSDGLNGELIGTLAAQIILSADDTSGQFDASFNPDEARIEIRDGGRGPRYYRVDPAFTGFLASIMDPPPEPRQPAPGMAAIPETGATP